MPALTTFHERLMAHLPALVSSVLEQTGAAYDARRQMTVEPRPLSAPIVFDGREPSSTSSRAWAHRYRVLLRVTQPDALVRSGSNQIATINAAAAKLERHFAHQRPLINELGADVIVVCDAVVEALDEQPEDEGGITGSVLLTFHTFGTGDLDGTQNPGG